MTFLVNWLFISMMMLSPILLMSASNFILVWLSLELSMFSFIPIIFKFSSMSSIKYFLVQSMGSIFVLMSFISDMNFLFVASMLKLGMAPLHFWLPSVASELPPLEMIFLLTIQKLSPLLIISFFVFSQMKIFFGSISAIIGSTSGLVQTQWRQVFSFSSISHLGWLIISTSVSIILFFVYFFFYVIALIQAALSSKYLLMYNSKMFNSLMNWEWFFMLLSLGGLPPMMGFLTKMFIIFLLSSTSSFLMILTILIISSLVSLFFYMKIFFILMMKMLNLPMKISFFFQLSSILFFLTTIFFVFMFYSMKC